MYIDLKKAKDYWLKGGMFREIALNAGYEEAELNPVKNEWASKVIDYGTKFISGWYLGDDSVYKETNEENTDMSTFKTEKQAKSALAYAQLTQLMALPEYNGDWVPDWNNEDEMKFCIICSREELIIDSFYGYRQKVCFKSMGLAERFLENNSDLLKQFDEMY